jgi:hypothetical protein
MHFPQPLALITTITMAHLQNVAAPAIYVADPVLDFLAAEENGITPVHWRKAVSAFVHQALCSDFTQPSQYHVADSKHRPGCPLAVGAGVGLAHLRIRCERAPPHTAPPKKFTPPSKEASSCSRATIVTFAPLSTCGASDGLEPATVASYEMYSVSHTCWTEV